MLRGGGSTTTSTTSTTSTSTSTTTTSTTTTSTTTTSTTTTSTTTTSTGSSNSSTNSGGGFGGEAAADGADVLGVAATFFPGLRYVLVELPGQEAVAELGGDGLRLAGAVVVAEAVIGQAQGFRQHPTLAVVLGQEHFEAHRLQVVEGHLGQNGVAQLR